MIESENLISDKRNQPNMSQTNGQHDGAEYLSNGPVTNYQYQVAAPSQQQAAINDHDQAPAVANKVTSPPISDFLVQLEDYTPTIPDSVTAHYLATAGLETTDQRILKLVSLAAQKFVSDVASDALTNCKMRQTASSVTSSKKGGKEKKYVMTVEDLSVALGDQGVNVKKPPYFQ